MNDLYYNHEIRLILLGSLFGFTFATVLYMMLDNVEKSIRKKYYKSLKISKLNKK